LSHPSRYDTSIRRCAAQARVDNDDDDEGGGTNIIVLPRFWRSGLCDIIDDGAVGLHCKRGRSSAMIYLSSPPVEKMTSPVQGAKIRRSSHGIHPTSDRCIRVVPRTERGSRKKSPKRMREKKNGAVLANLPLGPVSHALGPTPHARAHHLRPRPVWHVVWGGRSVVPTSGTFPAWWSSLKS
jgi:hypothetical protein